MDQKIKQMHLLLSHTAIFRDLRELYDRKMDTNLVNPNSASALWCLQMAHQTKLFKTPNQKRTLVMDNFYTRHVLGRQLKILSDEDIRIIRTTRFNKVDAVNRPHLKEALSLMSSKARGSWLLVQSFDKPVQTRQQHLVAVNSGFIVFNDTVIAGTGG